MRANARQKPIEKHFFVEGTQVYPGSHSEAMGKRKTMEDAATVVGEIFGPKTQYYGVFDGHGGSSVAMRCATRLHVLLKENYSPDKKIEDIITDTFHQLNAEIVPEYKATGSTASIALILGDQITVANVGDTRVLLVESNGSVIRLTTDHNTSNKEETKLIEQRGGTIYQNRVNGMISLTRCFGDGSQEGIISCDPFITTIQRKETDKLVIACDGVFEVISDEEVGKCCAENEEPSAAARAIKELAIKQGSTDNITVICVNLKPK